MALWIIISCFKESVMKSLVACAVLFFMGALTAPSLGDRLDLSQMWSIRGGDCAAGCVECTWIDDKNPAAEPPCNSCVNYELDTYSGKCTSQNTSVSLCAAKNSATNCTRCKNNYLQCGGDQLYFNGAGCNGTGLVIGPCSVQWVGCDVDTNCTPPCPHGA